MAFELSCFQDSKISAEYLDWLVEEQWHEQLSKYQKFWDYYQNTIKPISYALAAGSKRNESCRDYVQAQETGLPPRITGVMKSINCGSFGGEPLNDIERKEIVIENDIAWRINAMVDFLFGKGITILSKAKDQERRRNIQEILKAVFASNGGVGFFLDMAVLGSVYGFVDCIIRPGELFCKAEGYSKPETYLSTSKSTQTSSFEKALQHASTISLELIEAPRALPILQENDYRKIRYYAQNFCQYRNEISQENTFFSRMFKKGGLSRNRKNVIMTEIIGSDHWQKYQDKELVAEGENYLGIVPVVHIQNIARPYYYEGTSDVEPLIPLQDELNTRLSDRANRITFQSFKMYLAKGIEGIEDKEVMPGRMWCTENEDAEIEEFGGDKSTPSENEHIAEIREAMDKVSSVTPVVAGVLKNKIGNLTSAVALKMTLMGTLSKTSRKQYTYGEGIKKICKLILECYDKSGIYETDAQEREVEIQFPNPLPEEPLDTLEIAKIKKELGVPQEIILEEIGY